MRVQRWRTFTLFDWIVWGIMTAVGGALDALDIFILCGSLIYTVGLSIALPEPVLIFLGMLQVVVGKLFWNRSILPTVQLGLEFIPWFKYLCAAPLQLYYAVQHLRELVEVDALPPRRGAASLVTMVLSTGAGFLFWYYDLVPLTAAIAITAGTWILSAGLLRIEWKQVSLPRWLLAIGSLLLILGSFVPAAYHLSWVTPETYREAAWEKMCDAGIAAYFGNEVRAQSRGEKVNSAAKNLFEFLKSAVGIEDEEQQAEDSAQRRRIEKTLILNSDVVRLREKGLISSGADFGRDFLRYRSATTGQVAFGLYRERLIVYLYLGFLMVVVQALAWIWPVIERIPVKQPPQLPAAPVRTPLPPTPATPELRSAKTVELPTNDQKLLPP